MAISDEPLLRGKSSPLLLRKDVDYAAPPKHRHLGVAALAALIFFTATGGAYGTEQTVQSAGPFWALLGFLVLPWIWSLPQAMYTSELSTVLPVDGGISIWAKVAFSEYWGFQGGLWAWMEGCSTLAAYPTLVVDYLEEIMTDPLDPVSRWLLKAGCSLFFVFLNLRGVSWVGVSASTLGVLVLLPLVALSILGLPSVNPERWFESRDEADMNWTLFLNLMLWNMSGYDNMGSLSGEVKNPSATIPKAQIYAVVGGTLAYIVPLSVAIGVSQDWSLWREGHLAMVANRLGGQWLLIAILVGAAGARLSNFMAELCTNSFFLQGMSEQAMLPAILSWRHPRFDTPWVSILFNYAVVLILMMLHLGEILQLANLFTIASFVLGVASLLSLRESRPVQTRDNDTFTIPLNVPLLLLCLVPAAVVVVFCLIVCSDTIFLLSFCLFIVGQLLYVVMLALRRYNLVPFVSPPPVGEVWYTF